MWYRSGPRLVPFGAFMQGLPTDSAKPRRPGSCVSTGEWAQFGPRSVATRCLKNAGFRVAQGNCGHPTIEMAMFQEDGVGTSSNELRSESAPISTPPVTRLPQWRSALAQGEPPLVSCSTGPSPPTSPVPRPDPSLPAGEEVPASDLRAHRRGEFHVLDVAGVAQACPRR